MPKVKLSESELRKIILMSLHETDDATGATAPALGDDGDGLSFVEPFTPPKSMLADVIYLINARNALDRTAAEALDVSAQTSYDISLETMRAAVRDSDAGRALELTWDPESAALDSMAIYKAWLQLQIINTINNPKIVSRKVFYAEGAVYGTTLYLADPMIIAFDKLVSPTARYNINGPEFFNKLSDETFTKLISSESINVPNEGVAAPDPGIAFIDDACRAKTEAEALAFATQALTGMQQVWDQVDTDFVEEYFCLPVIMPNAVWQRASNTADPRSTPWRMSYGVFNIAAQAVGVPGGVAALYRKLFSYSTGGGNIQFASRPGRGDPFRPTGLFRESLEVKKTLMSITELRSVIQASLAVNLNGGSYRDNNLLESGFLPWFKRLIGYGDELTPLQKLAAKSTLSSLTPAEITAATGTLKSVFREIGLEDVDINRLLVPDDVLLPFAEMRIPRGTNTTDIEVLHDITSDVLKRVAGGEELNLVIADLTKSSLTAAGTIASLDPPRRGAFLRMIRSAKDPNGDGFLLGANRVKNESAEFTTNYLKKKLLDDLSIDLPARQIVAGGPLEVQTIRYDMEKSSFISKIGAGGDTLMSEEIARKVIGNKGVDTILSVNAGTIKSSTGDVSIDEAIRLFRESELVRVEQAIIGMLANPTISNATAREALSAGDAQRFTVGLDAIPTTSSSIAAYTAKLEGALGKYAINPDKSSRTRKILSFATAVERNIIAAPVRSAARGVNILFGGKGLLADYAGYLATNGLYSYLLGYLLYQAINLATPDISSTPSREASNYGILLALISKTSATSPIVPALANLVMDVLGKAFDSVTSDADTNVKALLDPALIMSSEENLAVALTAFFDGTTTSAANFPDLLQDKTAAQNSTAAMTKTTTNAVDGAATALTTKDSTAVQAGVEKVNAAVAAIASVLATPAGKAGNDVWVALEASRKMIKDLTISAIKATQSGNQGTVPNIASEGVTLTVNYNTITENEDMWAMMASTMLRTLTGRRLAIALEARAWLKTASLSTPGSGISPSVMTDFTSYMSEQGVEITADKMTIDIMNQQFKKLATSLSNSAQSPAPSTTTSTAPAP